MYCVQCNIDFPEGLRYCKWCGQPLADKPRTTSELQSCPSCATAVQPSWVFCKSCGAKLTSEPAEAEVRRCPHCRAEVTATASRCLRCGEDLKKGASPATMIAGSAVPAPQGGGTAIMGAPCPSCGEPLEAGSVYCKGCGARVPDNVQTTAVATIHCEGCHGSSPLGSTACRVCGASFGLPSAEGTEPQRPNKPGTLPDLADRLPGEISQELTGDFGAQTVIIPSPHERPHGSTGRVTEIIQESGELESETKGAGNETNVLPGSETVPSTSVLKKGRITNPVESGESIEELIDAGREAALSDNQPAPRDQRKTVVDSDELFKTQETPLPRAAQTRFDGTGPEQPTIPPPVSPSGNPPNHPININRDAGYHATREMAPPVAPADTSSMERTAVMGAPMIPEPPTSPAISTRTSSAPSVPAQPYQFDAPPPTMTQPRSGGKALKIAGPIVAVAVVLTLAGVLYWQLSSNKNPTTTRTEATPTPVANATPASTPAGTPAGIPDDMVRVAAGRYVVGRDGADPLESPPHEVELASFLIDKTEVTNAAYKKFVDATGHTPPSDWKDGTFPEGKDNYPVVFVSWEDAAAFAKWAGKRLPTEAEWEAAARGIQAFTYPWGNEWRAGVANLEGRAIMPVGQFQDGASPAGVLDMIGNVWEWTADEFKLYDGADQSLLEGLDMKPGVTYRVMRGGAFDGKRRTHGASYRGLIDASSGYPKVGFRLAKDAR